MSISTYGTLSRESLEELIKDKNAFTDYSTAALATIIQRGLVLSTSSESIPAITQFGEMLRKLREGLTGTGQAAQPQMMVNISFGQHSAPQLLSGIQGVQPDVIKVRNIIEGELA